MHKDYLLQESFSGWKPQQKSMCDWCTLIVQSPYWSIHLWLQLNYKYRIFQTHNTVYNHTVISENKKSNKAPKPATNL